MATERPILFSGEMIRAILAGRKTQTRRVIKPQPPDGITFAGQYRASHQPYDGEFDWCTGDPKDVDTWMMADTEAFRCPYGGVGDGLWVRETLYREEGAGLWHYKADDELVMVRPEHKTDMIVWAHHKEQDVCVSIHMPRWASRITLEIEDVRVERVQDISEEDAITEGLSALAGNGTGPGPGYKWHGIAYEGTTNGYFHAPRNGYCCCLKGRGKYKPAICAYRELWDHINAERGFGWDTNPFVWCLTFKRAEQAKVEAEAHEVAKP